MQRVLFRPSAFILGGNVPEIEVFEDGPVMMGKRRQDRDQTIEDALKTMERFADWLTLAQDPAQNVWGSSDAFSSAMLYGMLLHLRAGIDEVLRLGGEEARTAYEFFATKK